MKNVVIVVAVLKLISFKFCEADASFLTKLSEINLSEDGKLNFTQLVTKYGHAVEKYDVITEDGYIITLFHLPGEKSPVLLTHGLLDTGDSWVIRDKRSLGVALLDEGYDVWIMNNRGNRYARAHIRLNPDTDKKFWDFSFHEMGIGDLAAAIDFVRDETGEKQIFAIGHSQGCSQYFPLLSLRPEYNERIKLFIALAPAVYFNNMPPLFSTLADLGPIYLNLLETLGVEELFRDRSATSNLIKTVCSKRIIDYAVCAGGFIFPLFGFNPAGLEPEFLPTLVGHFPAGISRKCLVHYDQLYFSKKFRQFDYGHNENLAKYGSLNPPEYDLEKLTANVALMAGTIDKIVLIENVKLLQRNLPNVVHYEEIAATSHSDFVVGKEATKYLFPSIMKLLKEYEDKYNGAYLFTENLFKFRFV